MSENMETRDLTSLDESNPNPIFELPNGLNLEKITDKAKEWNKEWETASSAMQNNWEENAVLYKEFEKKAKKKVTTKTPEIWAQIQTELPALINSLFSRSEIVRPYPKYQDTNNNTIKMKLYVNSALMTSANARYKISDTIQNVLVYGTSVVKSYWDLSSDYEFNPYTGDWDEVVSGKPNFENVNIFDFAVDPTYRGHDPNLAPWIRHRVYYTKDDLMRLKQQGEIDNFEEMDLTAKEDTKTKDKINSIKNYDINKGKCHVDEFWATIFWEEDMVDEFGQPTGEKETKKDEFFFWLLNDKKVIKFKRNRFRFKPFMVTRCYRVSDEFFGQGEVDIMKAYAEQMSDIHTKAGVLAKRVGGKLTFYTPASGFNKQDAKSMENGLVMVDDLNQVRSEATTTSNDLQVMLSYKNSVRGDIEAATGINNIVKGEPVGDQTATEASLLNQNSTARLTGKLQNIQDEILCPLASAFFKMSKQFIEQYSFGYKGEMVNLTADDFVGDYEWQAVGSVSQSNRALQIKQKADLAMQLTQAAMQAQAVKAAGFDLMAFVQGEIMPLFDIPDPTKYFVEPQMPPMPPELGGGAGPDQLGPGSLQNIPSMQESIPQASDIEANSINPQM